MRAINHIPVTYVELSGYYNLSLRITTLGDGPSHPVGNINLERNSVSKILVTYTSRIRATRYKICICRSRN